VANEADISAPGAALLPANAALRTTLSVVALQVAKAAQEQGLAKPMFYDRVEKSDKPSGCPEYSPVVAM
jgi:malic enzyme